MNFFIGILIIATGFLVKIFPNIIAGYNTMSREEKENVDIKGLSSHLRNGMILIGLLVILVPLLLNWVGFSKLANQSLFFILFIGVILTVITAQRYDHNKPSKSNIKGKWVAIITISAAIVFSIGLILYGLFSTNISLENDTFKISGIYKTKIAVSSIERIELIEKLPKITLKTNGFNFGEVLKGNFKTEEFGVVKLYVEYLKGPFLEIVHADGKRVYINLKKIKSKDLFDELNHQIGK